MASSIPVRVTRVVDLDIDGFIKLATELFDELDSAQVLLPRWVGRLLPEGTVAMDDDQSWEDVITTWVHKRLEGEGA